MTVLDLEIAFKNVPLAGCSIAVSDSMKLFGCTGLAQVELSEVNIGFKY